MKKIKKDTQITEIVVEDNTDTKKEATTKKVKKQTKEQEKAEEEEKTNKPRKPRKKKTETTAQVENKTNDNKQD